VHDLTTEAPFGVWLAIANKARALKMDYPRLHVMRFAGSTLSDGVSVCLTNIARTAADCLKIRKTASHPSVREMSLGVVNSARCQIQIDIGFGNPVTLGP